MRLRIFAVALIGGLAYYAITHNTSLAMPDPGALILSARNSIWHPASIYRFSLSTDPESPIAGVPTELKVYVSDSDGHAADGLSVEAYVSHEGAGTGAQSVTLTGIGKGNYVGRADLHMPGSWDVNLSATKGIKSGKQQLSIDVGVREASSRSGGDDNDDQ